MRVENVTFLSRVTPTWNNPDRHISLPSSTWTWRFLSLDNIIVLQTPNKSHGNTSYKSRDNNPQSSLWETCILGKLAEVDQPPGATRIVDPCCCDDLHHLHVLKPLHPALTHAGFVCVPETIPAGFLLANYCSTVLFFICSSQVYFFLINSLHCMTFCNISNMITPSTQASKRLIENFHF